MNLAERIRQRLRELDMSQRELAERAGISQVAVHKLTSGKTAAPRKILEIAKALSCSPDWLKNGGKTQYRTERKESKIFDIPVLTAELAKETVGYIDFEQVTDWMPISQDWAFENHFLESDLVIMDMMDNSMLPRLQHGDMLLINAADQELKSGSVYAISLDSELHIKRFYKKIDGNWIISVDNRNDPAYQDEIVSPQELSQLQVIGRVVKILMGEI